MTTTRDEIEKLRRNGLSYAEIGRRPGISRERVRQIAAVKPKRVHRPNMLKGILMTGDAADYLGVHPNTVRCWSGKGILKSYRVGSRRDRRFRRENIDDFLKEYKFEGKDKKGPVI